MEFFSTRILAFYKSLKLNSNVLPSGIEVMNPFNNEITWAIVKAFYSKFYNDQNTRKLILGINPGRHGAGLTGIPFTDTKRLNDNCGIHFVDFVSHETSSVYVYEMIDAFGGAQAFYDSFYISSVSPLGFVKKNARGQFVNYNYYDNKQLEKALQPFIVQTIKQQLQFGIDTDVCYCLGTGKNYTYLSKLNEKMHFFKTIIPLEHPRYIMQYKLKDKEFYIKKYVDALN